MNESTFKYCQTCGDLIEADGIVLSHFGEGHPCPRSETVDLKEGEGKATWCVRDEPIITRTIHHEPDKPTGK